MAAPPKLPRLSASIRSLPQRYQADYLRERAQSVRLRASLYFAAAALLYACMTLQYLLRVPFAGPEVFRMSELPLLAWVLAGAVGCHLLNRCACSAEHAKRCVYLFTFFLLSAVTGYALIYYENAIFFCFYYGAALIFVALMIPWWIGEIVGLAVAYILGFSVYIGILRYLYGHDPFSYPRFHVYGDGLIFMIMAAFVSVVVRYNDIRQDLTNFLLLKRIEEQTHRFEKELELANRVHKTLVPDSLVSERADVAVSYIPMSYVGGDYARFRFTDDGRLVIFISDVTGHGVPAALLVNRVHAEFEQMVRVTPEPGALLRNLNRFISRDFEGTEMFLSAFCGLVDLSTLTLRYANYGHPSQYLHLLSSGEIRELGSHTAPLGILFEEKEHYEAQVAFGAGDRILLFTDGVLEAKNPAGEFYGETRLRDFMDRHRTLSNAAFNDRLVEELKIFSAGRFGDDVFILNIQIHG